MEERILCRGTEKSVNNIALSTGLGVTLESPVAQDTFFTNAGPHQLHWASSVTLG